MTLFDGLTALDWAVLATGAALWLALILWRVADLYQQDRDTDERRVRR